MKKRIYTLKSFTVLMSLVCCTSLAETHEIALNQKEPFDVHKHDLLSLCEEKNELAVDIGTNLLDLQKNQFLSDAISHNHLKRVQMLIHADAYVNALDYQGNQPLHHAVRNKSLKIVQELIHAGADVNALDYQGNQPLHHAVRNKSLKIVQELIHAGADVNALDYKGNQPLYHAVSNESLKIVQELIHAGADVNAFDYKGNQPYALCNGKKIIQQALIDAGAEVSVLDDKEVHGAARDSQVFFMGNDAAKTNSRDKGNWKLRRDGSAARTKPQSFTKVLLHNCHTDMCQRYPDVDDYGDNNNNNITPLYLFKTYGSYVCVDVVIYLLSKWWSS